jgi:DNA adenine methylase
MSVLRYPGGKSKVAGKIVSAIKRYLQDHNGIIEYREPFFGGGAVGLRLIQECPQLQRVWINDADPAMACLWRSLVARPASMRVILGCLEPSVGLFQLYKKLLRKIYNPEDLAGYDPIAVAAMKVACHRMSYSGLGPMAGSPIGGWTQSSKYDVGCRFDEERISRSIGAARERLTSVDLHPEVCTCLDFEELIRAPGAAIYYLDPPYYKAGPALYQVAFDHADHVRLARLLRDEERPWLLSYDQYPVIEELYGGWAMFAEVPISYSINGAVKSAEWLISNFPAKVHPEHRET